MSAPLRPCGVCMTPRPNGECPDHPRKSTGRSERAGAGAYNAIWRRVRNRALARDGYVCQYCAATGSTGDHVQPRSKGGRTVTENVLAACVRCNTSKGNRTLAEWIASGTAPAQVAKLLAERIRLGLPT